MRTLLVLSILVACDRGANAPAPPPVPPAKTDFSDPLALVPADSDLVMRIDVAAIRKSPLFAKYEKVVLESLFPAFLECSYDPLQEVTTVTLGLPMQSEQGVFVVRGLDRDKTLGCLRNSKTDTKTSVTFDGEFVTLTNQSGAVNMITFPEPGVMVMQGSKNPTKQTLTAALKSGAPLRRSALFTELEKKLAPDAALAMMSRPDSARFAHELEKKVGAVARYMVGTVHITDRVSAKFVVVLKDPKDAAALEAQMRPQAEQIKGFMDHYEVHASGDALTVELAMTEAQISALVDMVKSMMGGVSAPD